MARPGIMVYFDMMGPLKKLPDADKGRLFWAMLEYGKSGTVPEFDGLALSLAWEFVKPKIDKDSAEYERTILKRQYATFCRDRKKKGEPEITFDEWLNTIVIGEHQRSSMITNDNQNHHMISNDIKWYPTTTTTSSTTITPSTTTAAAATTSTNERSVTAATATKEEENPTPPEYDQLTRIGGPLGQDVVWLTTRQIDSLVEQLGIEAFDKYVRRLSDYIIENNAHVKNHYETILKWHKEDSKCDFEY